MSPFIAIFAAAALGIDVGWEPLKEGGVEYIIQIEPGQVDRIVNFDDVIAEVPADLDVRRYRITVGTKKLPRIYPTPGSRPADEAATDDATDNPADSPDDASSAREADDATTTAGATPRTAERPTETEQPQLEEPVQPKEIIAEGHIPGQTRSDAPQEPASAATDEATPNEPVTAQADEEGPRIPGVTETTAQRPISDDYPDTRDPEPVDEEANRRAQRATSRPTTPVPPQRDDLFQNSGSQAPRSRLLDEPSPLERSRPPRTERYSEPPVEDDYEAQKPPALTTTPFRTAQNTPRDTTSFDRDRSGSDWGPIVAIFFFLLMSMGANMWLGWIAWEARQRYQVLLEKYRAAGGKASVDLV